jgi:ketosteroid isomerase-like protein
MPRLLVLFLVAALALASCGGGDDQTQAKNTVKEFFAALHKRDGAKLCNHLLSKDFVETTTLASGDRAKEECKQQFKQLKGPLFKLVRVGKAEIKGDDARVATVIERENQPQPQVFRLKKEDGDWRLANPSG